MARSHPVSVLSALSQTSLGVFRGKAAVSAGVSRKQLNALLEAGIIERMLPDTYRMTVVTTSDQQKLRAAMLWAGAKAAAAGQSAGAAYRLEAVSSSKPEIVMPHGTQRRHPDVDVYFATDLERLMIREHAGVRVTGPEATLVRLAHLLDEEPFEIACEDARRRRLTTMPALNAYLDRYARPGQRGVASMRALLQELDPVHASRSTLEVKTRRLLVAHGFGGFVREFPLTWKGRTYLFDFTYLGNRTILETNGRHWHDDPTDYEDDHEKWSVPGYYGCKLVMATWEKVTERPYELLDDLRTALAA